MRSTEGAGATEGLVRLRAARDQLDAAQRAYERACEEAIEGVLDLVDRAVEAAGVEDGEDQ